MMYHASIPNGNWTEHITVEANSHVQATAKVRVYLDGAFGKEAESLLKEWNELFSIVKSGVVHFTDPIQEG